MRKRTFTVLVALLGFALFSPRMKAQSATQNGFDGLKALVGTWEAAMPAGEGSGVTRNNFRLVSNGTAIEETFQSEKDNQMVSLYTPDGDRIVMTHYCSMGNQPRLETSATEPGQTTFDFAFIGATNLKSPNDMHMHRMVFRVIDKDHFDETWTLMKDEKPHEVTFHFARKT